jgi:hypothetical protein
MKRMSATISLVYIGSMLALLGWQSCANQSDDDDQRRPQPGYAGGGYHPVFVGGRSSGWGGRVGGSVASHSGGFGSTGHAVGS